MVRLQDESGTLCNTRGRGADVRINEIPSDLKLKKLYTNYCALYSYVVETISIDTIVRQVVISNWLKKINLQRGTLLNIFSQ